jgi:phosphate transport system substrate-binding protein
MSALDSPARIQGVHDEGTSKTFGVEYCAGSTCRSLLRICLLFLLTPALGSAPAHARTTVILVGSGSTVPAPLYSRWAQEYGKRNHNTQMQYLPVGTSEGIKQIARGVGDFSAGEAQLRDKERKKERKEDSLIELPIVLIAITPIYNLPEIHQELRLSGEVLAEIFLGDVKTWNAPPIAKLNPDITLPNLPIQVVNRPAGKGSNYVFTDFLSKVISKSRAQIGTTTSPKWPVGTPAERSSDMAAKVKNNPGSIGYAQEGYTDLPTPLLTTVREKVKNLYWVQGGAKHSALGRI